MMIGALDAPRRQLAEIDYALLWSVLMLLFAGLVMVYSASIAIAEAGRFTNHQPAYYLVASWRFSLYWSGRRRRGFSNTALALAKVRPLPLHGRCFHAGAGAHSGGWQGR
jgi:cell division protein FtsW (lipid II flippase)